MEPIDTNNVHLTFKIGESFDVKKEILFKYLLEGIPSITFRKDRTAPVKLNNIFSRIKNDSLNHKYLPNEKVDYIDFVEVFDALESEWYILCYKQKGVIFRDDVGLSYDITFLEPFFEIPLVKKAQKDYAVEKEKNSLNNIFSKFSTSKWFEPFPSKDNRQIDLVWSTLTIGDKTINFDDVTQVQCFKDDYEVFEPNAEEIETSGNKAKNTTIKWNFYRALIILLSALSVWQRNDAWQCVFKMTDILSSYEKYSNGIFNDYVSSSISTIENIQKRRSAVNALLRWAKVWEDGDTCFQLDNLPKPQSPSKESGWYVIKKMNKITRDGQKINHYGQKTRGYSKRIKKSQ